MADLNSFSFTGRLTKDAVVRTTNNGKKYLEADVANNTGFGEYAKTTFFKVKMWGDRADSVVSIFTKGALIATSGELTVDEWTGNDGEKKKTLIVTVNNLQLLYRKREDSNEKEEPQF